MINLLKKMLKKWGVSVLAISIGGMLIFAALAMFQLATLQTVEQNIHNNMVEINQTAALTMKNGLESCRDLLELQAKMLGEKEKKLNSEKELSLLSDFAQDARFERLSAITLKGRVYSSTFGVRQLDSLDAIPNLKAEETIIGQPRVDADGLQTINIGTPIYYKNEKVGRLIATLDDEILQTMYNATGLEGDAALCMFSGDGTVIATFAKRKLPIKPGDNVFAFTERSDVKLIEGTTKEYKRNVRAQESGWLKYRFDGKGICLNYEPMEVNDWYMSITATDDSLNFQSQRIRRLAILLTLFIVIAITVVFAIVLIQRVREQEQMDAMKNTYSIAIRKTNDLFYEADIDNDELVDYSESSKKAVWKETPKNYSNALEQIASVCSPECRQEFLDTFLPQNIKIKIKEGISSINFEYKIIPNENTVRWLSATFVPITDGKDHCSKIICMENDITERKLRQERLKHSATIDGLTGLYNRITTQTYIDAFLEGEGEEGQHALLLIDIDYFKGVNDTLGHGKGDEVISEYGNVLRRIFRKDDIVGRIGGDEFIVLLKNYGVMELITAKAKAICDGFRQEQFLKDNPKKVVKTSASIGIALYTKDGKDFSKLYKSADTALYVVKNKGRDGFDFYAEEV
ncbi:MAG: sensor domain-containing diguanylate cyclase [Acetivibrio sp.]